MGNQPSMAKCAVCGSTSFENRITATGLPVFDETLLSKPLPVIATQPPNQQLSTIPHTRQCCEKCGAPSHLADVPAPAAGAKTHPDMLNRVKFHIFPETLPPHLQLPGTSSDQILETIVPFFLTGKSKPVLGAFLERHQERLLEAQREVQLCFDNAGAQAKNAQNAEKNQVSVDLTKFHRAVNNYLQLDFNAFSLLRGQLIRHGQEYLIPYEDRYMMAGQQTPQKNQNGQNSGQNGPTSPYQTLRSLGGLSPTPPSSPSTSPSLLTLQPELHGEPRCIRVMVSQCYPSVGYLTQNTVTTLGHSQSSKNWIMTMQILPTSHSLESPMPLTRVPKLYFSWFVHCLNRKTVEKNSKGNVVISDDVPSSGWTLSSQETLVRPLSTYEVHTIDVFKKPDVPTLEELAFGDLGGVMTKEINFWSNGVAFHNSTVSNLQNMTKDKFDKLAEFNGKIMAYEPRVNVASNEKLYKDLLDTPLRVIQQRATALAQLDPDLQQTQSTIETINQYNPALEGFVVDKKMVKKFNGTVQHVGNHMYMGKTFIVDPDFDKINASMKKEVEKVNEQRKKDIKAMMKFIGKQAEKVEKERKERAKKGDFSEEKMQHLLEGQDPENPISILPYLTMAESVTYRLFSPQATGITDLDDDYLGSTPFSIREQDKAKKNPNGSFSQNSQNSQNNGQNSQNSQNSSFSRLNGVDSDVSFSVGSQNGRNGDQNGQNGQSLASNGQLLPGSVQHLGHLRSQSNDAIISAHYFDPEGIVVPHDPRMVNSSSQSWGQNGQNGQNSSQNTQNFLHDRWSHDRTTKWLFQMSKLVRNVWFMNFFKHGNKAPQIYTNASENAVGFQIIRCDPEDGYLSPNTMVYYAPTSRHNDTAPQPNGSTENRALDGLKEPIRRLGWIGKINLLPISSTIPLKHRYSAPIDKVSHPTAFKNLFHPFVKSQWELIRTGITAPEVVLRRFRETYGVESIETAQQLLIQNYLQPGLLGSYRRFRKGQTVNINGAWFYVADTMPSGSSGGGIVTANTIISCSGPWLEDEHLPEDATLGAVAKAEGERFARDLRERQQVQQKQLEAAESTSFYQKSMNSSNSFATTNANAQSQETVKWEEDYGEDSGKNGKIPLEVRNAKSQQALLQSIYSTPMSAELRHLCLEFVQSFKEEDPILAVFERTLKDQQRLKTNDLNLTQYRSYLSEYRQDTRSAMSKELLETMVVYAFDEKRPEDDSKRFKVSFLDSSDWTKIKYTPVGSNANKVQGYQSELRTLEEGQGMEEGGQNQGLGSGCLAPPSLGFPDDCEQSLHAQYTTCQICLHEYCDGDYVRILPCGHRLHQACSDGWLRLKAICPVARCSGLLQRAREQQKERAEAEAEAQGGPE